MLGNRSNFTFLKAVCPSVCQTYAGAERKWAGSSPYISKHMFWKLFNTSASNNVSFEHTNHDIHPHFSFQNLYKLFFQV